MDTVTKDLGSFAQGDTSGVPARGRGLPAIAFWALVGGVGSFGIAAAMAPEGVILIALALVLAVLGLGMDIDRRGMPAAFIGAALGPLYVAWLNRSGPGEVCEAIPGGVICSEQGSPWPWVGVAALLALAGVAWLRRLQH